MSDISVSEERFLRLFADFKLDLFRELQATLGEKANKSDLIELAKDVGAIKREQDERRHLSNDVRDLSVSLDETRRQMGEIKEESAGDSAVKAYAWRVIAALPGLAALAALFAH